MSAMEQPLELDIENLSFLRQLSNEERRKSPGKIRQVMRWVRTGVSGETPNARPQTEIFQMVSNYKIEQKMYIDDIKNVYDIIKLLGSGGYGKVYKIQHKQTGDVLAVKKLKPKNEVEYQSIINEINMMAMIEASHSPNLLKFHGAYAHQKSFWLTMELMDFSLCDLCQNPGRKIQEAHVAYILREILQGLQTLHELGKVHRDIKSENVLMNMEGDVKVSDFGFTAQLTQGHEYRKTQLGTAFWMAPEIIRGEEYTTMVDIWSLGIVAIEIVEGKPPLIDIAPGRAAYLIAINEPPKLKSYHRFSREFNHFISAWLQKDPNLRMTANELLSHPFLFTASSRTEFSAYISKWMDYHGMRRSLTK